MDTSYRNYEILRSAISILPELKEAVSFLKPEDIGWNISDAAEAYVSLTDNQKKKFMAFWKERFFSSEWLKHDKPYAGVKELLFWLQRQGLNLVYLTGRDETGMKEGTRRSFESYGLPCGSDTRFILKPYFEMPDLDFKETACDKLAAEGSVVLAVENEPANANHMFKAFPGALVICIDTITSPEPAPLSEGIILFRQYSF